MTDCNDNQLLVKAQIENDRAAAQDQQVATADQLLAPQPAPDAPSTTPTQPARAQSPTETSPSTESQSTTAPSATQSNLDRIGLGTKVVRTAWATDAAMEGEQPSTSGTTIPSQSDRPGSSVSLVASEMDILDIGVGEAEDFLDIDLSLADKLLGENPQAMIKSWVDQYNRDVTFGLDQETQPDLERDLANLELTAEETPPVSARAVSSAVQAPTTPPPVAAAEGEGQNERPSTIAAQPGLTLGQKTFRIEGVGEFRREDGQPTTLYAYPPVVKPTEPMEGDPDQAYRGQDLVDPMVIRPRQTRRDRLRRQGEAQIKR